MRLLKILLYLVLVLVVLLAIVEAGFRLTSILLKPEIPETRPGLYTILTVGDSSTYGLGASDKNKYAYPSWMRYLLDSNKFQVINIGLPGINSTQAVIRLRDTIASIHPDLVLVNIGINDPWNWEETNYTNYLPQRYSPKFVDSIYKLALTTKTARFLKLMWLSGEMPTNKGLKPQFNKKTTQLNDAIFGDRKSQSRFLEQTLNQNIKAFIALANANDAHIIFLEYHSSGWRHPETIIHQIYRTLDLQVVPLESMFKKARKENLDVISADNWHPNDRGYLLIAWEVLKVISPLLPEPITTPDGTVKERFFETRKVIAELEHSQGLM